MAIAPERQRKDDYNRWRKAYEARCSHSVSDMVKHLKTLRDNFFRGFDPQVEG